MKLSPRFIFSLAVGAAGATAAFLWGRKKSGHPTSNRGGHDFDPNLVYSIFGKKFGEDDLTAIEGIGPKIAELLEAAGIRSWKDLSRASAGRCKEVLDAADGFSLHDPTTWPKQAKLAAAGKWQRLKDWQDELKGGRS